tara:strand:- start:198 stop:1178 length:981 start_codon:yes stop_codon:yes gene_type:complete
MSNELDRKFCVAPMMGYTTPYARTLYRLLSKKAFLFSEMIASNTLIYSKNFNTIIENKYQNPIALQVGGSDPDDLLKCSKIATNYNYDEINLNLGCPSKAVQKGSFGACLMQDKSLVRNCIEKMQENKKIEVTLKCRIGIGKKFNYNFFEEFIDELNKTGIKIIYVHARNALLNGLSPKGNRIIPPLNYDFVRRIKQSYPNIKFIINGGINSMDKAVELSKEFDGVMLGRLIQNNPFCLNNVDKNFYNSKIEIKITKNIINKYFEYIKPSIGKESIYRLLSPMLQIFFNVPNSKEYKIKIHNNMKKNNIDKLENIFLDFIDRQKTI